MNFYEAFFIVYVALFIYEEWASDNKNNVTEKKRDKMAKIRLVTMGRRFVPDVSWNEEGKIVKNRDLEEGEKIVCELKAAGIDAKSNYLGSYTLNDKESIKTGEVKQFSALQYSKCTQKQCTKITNLEGVTVTDGEEKPFEINNGRQLAGHMPTTLTDDIMKEIFFKVCGIHADDQTDEADTGELSEKE